MNDVANKRPTMPAPTLAYLAAAASEAFYPPAQVIWPGVKSYLNYPFALIAGFRILRLDLHLPEGRKGPLPVIVFASGGAWRIVAKNFAIWKFLLAEGYAIASIEYRLSDEAKFPAPVHDVKAAFRWVRGNAETFGLDGDRVAGWGASAGAYLMNFAAATNGDLEFEGVVGEHLDQSSRIDCVIDHYGPSDPLTFGEDTNDVPGAMEPMGTDTSPETLLLGYRPADRPAEAARASVLTYVTKEIPPFLVMHGDADTRLGIGQSRRLHRALEAVGADVEFHVIAGANHAGPEFATEASQAIERAFLLRALGPGAASA